ncbi:hypothetical protein [[Clostridium] hylemonae]|uniref:hypothetical protein n=1 Tax=[Clostridium] hylemonae TaxID=89153 RepID=UPI0036F3D5EA
MYCYDHKRKDIRCNTGICVKKMNVIQRVGAAYAGIARSVHYNTPRDESHVKGSALLDDRIRTSVIHPENLYDRISDSEADEAMFYFSILCTDHANYNILVQAVNRAQQVADANRGNKFYQRQLEDARTRLRTIINRYLSIHAYADVESGVLTLDTAYFSERQPYGGINMGNLTAARAEVY